MDGNNQDKRGIRSVLIFGVFFGMLFFYVTGGITMDRPKDISYILTVQKIMTGLFVLFIFFVVKSAIKTTKVKPENIANYSYAKDRHCTSCHEAIHMKHVYCPNCGAKQKDYIECDYCGHQNSKDDLMCTNCNGLLK